ncbi:hypothetical protein CORC01_05264 [Colletotrichum orchidophilum]|uniref:Interferon-induced 6-16 n=1 Tax=Colletotrichum orchidophilum TaxID=1209926 RepID=A0A1G4BDI4_9PEZI|nr:uncharacterized protein CORC01_05264 [Colletotrichum orchidophilum]OHE99464.1 hypothetical protein CORC01_05264 [Colletotrichum orchidophilum]
MQVLKIGNTYAEVAAIGLLRAKLLSQLLLGVGGGDTEPPADDNADESEEEPSGFRKVHQYLSLNKTCNATDTLAITKAGQWMYNNPAKTIYYGATAGSLVVLAAPALVAAPALGAAGFGAQGIVAGSAAAGVQAGIGNVVAPSLFATLQSAGAAGYGAAAVNGAVQIGAGVFATTFAWFGAKNEENEKHDGKDDENEDERRGGKQNKK